MPREAAFSSSGVQRWEEEVGNPSLGSAVISCVVILGLFQLEEQKHFCTPSISYSIPREQASFSRALGFREGGPVCSYAIMTYTDRTGQFWWSRGARLRKIHEGGNS